MPPTALLLLRRHHFGRAEDGDKIYDADMPYDKYTEWGRRREEYNLTEAAVKEMVRRLPEY